MDKKQAIKEIDDLIARGVELYNGGLHTTAFSQWWYAIGFFINKIYGENSSKIDQLNEIQWQPIGWVATGRKNINSTITKKENDAYNFGINATLGLLSAIRDEISNHRNIRKLNKDILSNENSKEFLNINDTWEQIKSEYGISKSEFAKKISFIEINTRTIIYRDIAHAFYLSKIGFNKSAIILAGSVIEELLRNFLISNDIMPRSNKFDDYIKQCEENELLKEVIGKLSHSIRIFRNFVHIPRELESPKFISKSTAIGAVSNIFTIVSSF